MHWFERKIRRYEHRRWTTDDNRRVQPFHWGLEHIRGSPHHPNPPHLPPHYPPNPLHSITAPDAPSPPPHRPDGHAAPSRTPRAPCPRWHSPSAPPHTAPGAARRRPPWLEQPGYPRLGILGTRIGSPVGYITLVHDERIRAGGFFHVSTYY